VDQLDQKLRQSTTTMSDHIRELQMRIIVSVISLGVVGFVAYLFYGRILEFLSSPLGSPLYYTSPAGGFAFVMKICLMCAVIVTIPIIFYNVVMFIRPAFMKVLTMKRVLVTTVSSTLLAISGAIFAFYCILPGSLLFFKGYQVKGLSALISADSYLGFVTNIIITFVIVFQIPLIIGFIDTIKPLKPKQLLKLEKWVVIGSLVIALLAPFTYDLVTSILIAVPIIILYNLSIIVVALRHSNKKRSLKHVHKNNRPKPEMIIDDAIAELIEDEPVPKQIPATPNLQPQKAFMDIRPTSSRPATVTSAAWVKQRNEKRLAVSSHVRVISDIHVPNRVNRASA
jgi:sec-independent protein translocase protein TatC